MIRHTNIEIEMPVNVVGVKVAGTAGFDAGKTKVRPDRTIYEQSPFTDIAIPARLQFADEHLFLTVNICTYAVKIAYIGSVIDDCSCRRRT